MRQLEALVAARVEGRRLRDRRRGTQELRELEPVRLGQALYDDVAGLRGDPHRPLDVADEVPDVDGGALRHLALQGVDRLDAFAVPEDELEHRAGDETPADEQQRDHERPPEKPAGRRGHRMIRSAV